MAYLEHDNPKIRVAMDILHQKMKKIPEHTFVTFEKNGELHCWLDSRWDFCNLMAPPWARVLKKDDNNVYLCFQDGEEIKL